MKTKSILFWTPRILTIVFAAFISIFALDVFNEHHGFWDTAVALLMHLVPTAIVLILLSIAWRWEWIGGVAFTALGLLYLFTARVHWSAYVLIAGPLLLLGALFLLCWWQRRASSRPA